MLHISHLPVPKSGMIKLPFLFFSVQEMLFFLLKIVCANGEGNNVTEGSGIPHGNSRLESLTMQSKFLREVEEYASECLFFLTYTPNGSYDRALKNLQSLFHFLFSFNMAVNCTDCMQNWTTVSLRLFSSSVLQVSFMLTVLFHHLCCIFLLQLESKWYS